MPQAELTRRYKQTLGDVTAILLRHDPIGIITDENADEYAPEAGLILARLRADLSIEQATDIVHRVFVEQFSETDAGPKAAWASCEGDPRDLSAASRVGFSRHATSVALRNGGLKPSAA